MASQTYIDTLDLTKAQSGWGVTQANHSINGNALGISGEKFNRGVGAHANGAIRLQLDGKATLFSAWVGVDDEVTDSRASVVFKVIGDGKTLWESPTMRMKDSAKEIKVDLKGIHNLQLLTSDANDGNLYDHADWGNAFILHDGAPPVILDNKVSLEMADSMLSFEVKGNQVYQLYFGSKLTDVSDASASNLAYPTLWDRPYSENAISVIQGDGRISLDLDYTSHTLKKLSDNQTELTFNLADPEYPVEVELHYLTSKKENVVEQWAVVKNKGKEEISIVHAASGFIGLHANQYFLTTFTGSWGAEALMHEEELVNGIKEVNSLTGTRTSQTGQPAFLLSLNHPAEEDHGEVILGNLAWSGNWRMRFAVGRFNRLTSQIGYDPSLSRYRLKKNETLKTPRLILTHSSHGKGEATRNLHRWARKYGLRGGDEPRRILLNSWEGAYFSFDDALIKRMITDAAQTGIELFVLDDGWFGMKHPRNNDRAGLGDWMVNTNKLKGGIQGLIDHAKKEHIDFGIWVEPEMVNPKSELYENHPDWVIELPKRQHRLQRTQLGLDLSNPEVQDYIIHVMDDLLGNHPGISYIKWDCNRAISDPGSNYLTSDRQEHLWIDYVKGYYRVLQLITQKYPQVTFQVCGSGGGRTDYGSMKYHHEFWTSDNTDARERIMMQWSINHLYPAMATAAHVTEVPSHQTGRITPIKYRFDVAMTGRLGFELRPDRVPASDMAFSKKAIQTYKEIRPVVQFGDLYRLRSPFKSNMASLMYLYKQKDKPSEALFFAFTTEKSILDQSAPVKLKGLTPSSRYRLTEINLEKPGKTQTRVNGKTLGGDYLMEHGIPISWRRGDYQSLVIKIEEVPKEPAHQ